jgi:hypothetical protein
MSRFRPLVSNRARMPSHPEIPPPGAHLPFLEWCAVLTAEPPALSREKAVEKNQSATDCASASLDASFCASIDNQTVRTAAKKESWQ